VSFTTTSNNAAARSHAPHPSLEGDKVYVPHDLGDEVSGIDIATGNIDFSIAPILRAESDCHPVRPPALGVVARRRHGEAHRPRYQYRHRLGDSRRSTRVGDAHALRAHAGGQPATRATLAFVDTVKPALIGTVQIAGDGTFGDLAVITKDGRHVYATFDAAPNGSGGVAVVDVRERKVRRYVGVPAPGAPTGFGTPGRSRDCSAPAKGRRPW
jgi:hypothetical protein